MYKVAVVIPTLNEEKFIACCLDSVIAQSYPFNDMEVMVVDGGSKDRTKDIVEEYKRKYQNIRFLNNPGRIQSIAFNIGVKSSDAPYIVRLDAHALYNKDYIEKNKDYYNSPLYADNPTGETHMNSVNTTANKYKTLSSYIDIYVKYINRLVDRITTMVNADR